MANRHNLFICLYLASLWLLLGRATPVEQSNPKFLYRYDIRSPNEIKQAGGFLPRGFSKIGDLKPDSDFSIFDHANALSKNSETDAYISFKTLDHAKQQSVSQKDAAISYIYKVKTTPVMIDVDKTLGDFNPQTITDSFAALGGVHWDQVVSWRKINQRRFKILRWAKSTENKDYNKKRYKGLRAGGAEPALAGFPANSEAWNREPWADYKPC
ncbi:ADP-ribosylation, partial [Colletotrichum eremochloae]